MNLLKKIIFYFILPAIVAGIYVATNLPRIYTHGLNNDELIYIRRTQLFEKYITGDFASPIWQSWDAYDQPPITQYVYGIALADYAHQYGGYSKLLDAANVTNNYYPCEGKVVAGKSPQHYDFWKCLDSKPPSEFPESLDLAKELLFRTRTVAIISTALTLALITLIGTVVLNPLVGILAAIYVGWFSLFGTLGVMGMIDPILYSWYALGLLFIVRKKNLCFAIALGLALSTKFNAGSLLIVFLLANVKNPKTMFVTGALSLTIFIGLNPFLWSNPIQNTLTMATSRTYAFQDQQQANRQSSLTTVAQRIVAIKDSIKNDEIFYAITLLFISGTIAGLTQTKTRSLALTALVEVGALLIYLPLNWDRYFLPLFPSISIVASLGLFKIHESIKLIWKYKKSIGIIMLVGTVLTHLPGLTPLEWTIVSFTSLLLLQGSITTIAMAYTFFQNKVHSPTRETQAPTSFSLLVPAKFEANVINHTIKALSRLDYPAHLVESLILIPAYDYETILAAKEAIEETKSSNIRIIQLDGDTNTKAYSLNLGLHFAANQVIGIFDAEDEPQPELLTRINQEFIESPETKAVQAAVQLTNIHSAWFAAINCLEYYFWFKSVLPFLSQFNAGLIAGNTVFIQKQTLNELGGWDEKCLTEDADLGVRLNVSKARVRFVYEEKIATLEETTKNEIAFIRQRSRWDQGFIQVIQKGMWTKLPRSRERLLTLYTLAQPIFRHLAIINMLIVPLIVYANAGKVSLAIALFSWIPGYFVLIQMGLYLYGLRHMTKTYKIQVSPLDYASTLIFFYPYQLLLCLGSLRGIVRLLSGNQTWDKTSHFNLHREGLLSE